MKKNETIIKKEIENIMELYKDEGEKDFKQMGLDAISIQEANEILRQEDLNEITQKQLNKIKEVLK